jgi:hypothetical protein
VLATSLAVALGLAVAGLVLTPDGRGVGTHEQLGLPPCATMALWGIPCPGCGVTTSVALASHGCLLASLANQPFGFAVWLAAVAFVAWSWVQHLRGRDLWVAVQAWNAGRWIAAAFVLAGGAWVYKLVRVLG